jgi:hypothetical protein
MLPSSAGILFEELVGFVPYFEIFYEFKACRTFVEVIFLKTGICLLSSEAWRRLHAMSAYSLTGF